MSYKTNEQSQNLLKYFASYSPRNSSCSPRDSIVGQTNNRQGIGIQGDDKVTGDGCCCFSWSKKKTTKEDARHMLNGKHFRIRRRGTAANKERFEKRPLPLINGTDFQTFTELHRKTRSPSYIIVFLILISFPVCLQAGVSAPGRRGQAGGQ